jgi:hypothetical protein
LTQQQVVCEDTNRGTASVGVPTDRNKEGQFGITRPPLLASFFTSFTVVSYTYL